MTMLLAVGCKHRGPIAAAGDILVESGYAYPPAGDNGAAYLRIQNRGALSDTLFGVTGPDFGQGMLMGSNDGEMTDLAMLVIPGGETIAMRPGAFHLMLESITRPPAIGDRMDLTLRFARAGAVSVSVPVVKYGEMPE